MTKIEIVRLSKFESELLEALLKPLTMERTKDGDELFWWIAKHSQHPAMPERLGSWAMRYAIKHQIKPQRWRLSQWGRS